MGSGTVVPVTDAVTQHRHQITARRGHRDAPVDLGMQQGKQAGHVATPERAITAVHDLERGDRY